MSVPPGVCDAAARFSQQVHRLSHPDLPIFTLPVPKSRIYIVTDPSLAAAVQRASRALSFTPLVPDITKRILDLDERTVEIARQNLDPEKDEPRGFLADTHDLVYGFLGPGENLNDLSRAAAEELGHQLNSYADDLRRSGAAGETVDLLDWVRHLVTIGTAKFLYGPHNPIAVHPELEQAFWDFDHGLGGLLMGIFPSITARKAYKGREAIAKALTEYLEAGRQSEASKLVQQRMQIAVQYDWSINMIARSDLTFLFAGIVNTATTVFWFILRIFADPELLQTIRAEVEKAVAISAVAHGGEQGLLSIEVLKENCPTLTAVFRETLRVGSESVATRVVKEDTMLAGRYFLRKGSVVQISGGAIHANPSIWGQDVEHFNHERFMGKLSVHPAAFRSFGGGKTLCPGRHFATNEILCFVAMILLTIDVEAPDGGRIVVPPKNDGVMPVHVLEPREKDAVKVVLKVRDEGEVPKAWRVVM